MSCSPKLGFLLMFLSGTFNVLDATTNDINPFYTEMYHGLRLQYNIMKPEASGFIFSDNSETLNLVESLIDIINQQKAVQALRASDSGSLLTTIDIVLAATADDACSYLKQRLSGSYADFNCTEQQLTEVAAKIRIYMAVNDAEFAVSRFHGRNIDLYYQHQCQYWNSRVLGDCSSSVANFDALYSQQQETLADIYLPNTNPCTFCDISTAN